MISGLCYTLNYREVSKNMESQKRENFLKIYSNLPLGVRQEIILVLDGNNPITWSVAFIEVQTQTPIGEVILERLEKLGII